MEQALLVVQFILLYIEQDISVFPVHLVRAPGVHLTAECTKDFEDPFLLGKVYVRLPRDVCCFDRSTHPCLIFCNIPP